MSVYRKEDEQAFVSVKHLDDTESQSWKFNKDMNCEMFEQSTNAAF